MSQILQIFCTLLSSSLLSLAIPNEYLDFGSPMIGIFSLFPFYIALKNSKSLANAFLLCFIHGAVTHLFSSFWLGNFMGFALFTLGASDLGTGVFEGFFSLGFYFPILFAQKSERLEFLSGKRHFLVPLRIISFAAVYTIWEYCKSTGFLAYPWGTLSMTAYRWKAITQIADITGVYGITFLFAFFSAVLAEGVSLIPELAHAYGGKAIFKSYRNTFFALASLFTISFAYGSYQIFAKRTPAKTMNTVLVQQNRNPNRLMEEENLLFAQELTQKKLDEASQNGKKCDLVVWSEAVLSKKFPAAELFYTIFPPESPLLSFVKKNGVPFIIGGPVVFSDERHEYGNSALLFDKNGNFSGSYSKMHLVPFAEQIPFSNYEPIRKIIKAIIGFSYGWTPGKKAVTFDIPLESQAGAEKPQLSATVSTPICFDDSAHEVCRALYLNGSEVFVNITNDSWSKTESAEIQHFVVAHYRSIEYRTTTIRSANAGYTCVISPEGKVLSDLPLFQEGALFYEVPVFERKMTVYALFGDWLPYTLLILAFAYILLVAKRSRKAAID